MLMKSKAPWVLLKIKKYFIFFNKLTVRCISEHEIELWLEKDSFLSVVNPKNFVSVGKDNSFH